MAEETDLLTVEAPAEPTQWYSEENKEVVDRCGWKEPNDVIKGYRGLEKDYSGRVKMPSPESSAEEIRAFYQKTGCPENPEGYEIKDVSENIPRSESVEAAIKQIAYDQGVSKQAFESIVKGYYDQLAADLQKGREQGEVELRQEFADEYDKVVTIANRFFDTCSEEFCDLVKQSGLANHPVFIKEFMNKGKQTMSDTLIKGGGGETKKDDYTPANTSSPGMYAHGEDEESEKARAYFTARGHKY